MALPTFGYPDGGVNPSEIAAVGVDPSAAAEYAAFGFTRIDGLGRPQLVERWADGLGGWLPDLALGGSANVTKSPQSFVAPNALQLVAGGGVGNGPVLRRAQTFSPASRVGMEIATAITASGGGAGPNASFKIAYAPTGATRYILQLNWDAVAPVGWQLLTTAGLVTIGSNYMATGLGSFAWQTNKIVADFRTGKYRRAMIGGEEIDLTGYDMTTEAGQSGLALITFAAQQRAISGETISVGYFVMTRDEP